MLELYAYKKELMDVSQWYLKEIQPLEHEKEHKGRKSSNSPQLASKKTTQVDLHLSSVAISTLGGHRNGRQAGKESSISGFPKKSSLDVNRKI